MSTVDLWNATLNEDSSKGFLAITYVETYQVIMDLKNASPFAVLIQAGIPPAKGSYATPSGDMVYVVSRVPVRVDKGGTDRKWHVNVTYSNDQQTDYLRDESGAPVSTPPEAVKSVDITYEEISEPIVDAKLLNVTDGSPSYDGGTPINIPAGHPVEQMQNNIGAVCNSACIPLLDQYKSGYRKRLTVWRYELGWNAAYENYLMKINSDTVTITQSDGTAQRFSETYEPYKLMIKDIIKQDFWYNSILYYRVGFVLDVSASLWVHSFADEGTQRCLFDGQFNPITGAAYTEEELTKAIGAADYGWQNITTFDEKSGLSSAIGDPVPFDGLGVEISTENPGKRKYMNWDVYKSISFGPLNL